MKSFALGLLVLLGTLLLGLAIGIGLYFALAALASNDELAQSIGLGAWWLSAIVLFAYANLWLDPFRRRGPAEGANLRSSSAARLRDERLKAQTAEIRGAVLFAMIGGLMVRSQSPFIIIAVALACGFLGWFFGADYKRRMNRSLDRAVKSSHKATARGRESIS